MIHHLELPPRPPVIAAPGGLAFRSALGTHGRAALELLCGEEVLAVYVDTAFSGILTGALRGRHQGEQWALAWGRRSPDGEVPAVAFEGGGPLRRRSLPVPVAAVGERFWVARAVGVAAARSVSVEGGGRRVGEFRTVTAAVPGRVESWRLAPAAGGGGGGGAPPRHPPPPGGGGAGPPPPPRG
ncbi:hypothetical protein ACWGCW_08350, partial [Streptomyces sp. NPDC054933]